MCQLARTCRAACQLKSLKCYFVQRKPMGTDSGDIANWLYAASVVILTAYVLSSYLFYFILTMEWTNDKVIKLIDLYRDHPVLWDCRLIEYKDRNKRMDALLKIAVSFGVEKEEIERKIKNLVCHLSRELKKEREGTKSGSGTDSGYRSKWFCYNSMVFLKDRNLPRGKTDTQVDISQNYTDFKTEDVSLTNSYDLDMNDQSSVSSEPPEKRVRTAFEVRNVVSKDYQLNQKEDYFDLIGRIWGTKLRHLPVHMQPIAEKAVNDVLFEALMGTLTIPHQRKTEPSEFVLP